MKAKTDFSTHTRDQLLAHLGAAQVDVTRPEGAFIALQRVGIGQRSHTLKASTPEGALREACEALDDEGKLPAEGAVAAVEVATPTPVVPPVPPVPPEGTGEAATGATGTPTGDASRPDEAKPEGTGDGTATGSQPPQ